MTERIINNALTLDEVLSDSVEQGIQVLHSQKVDNFQEQWMANFLSEKLFFQRLELFDKPNLKKLDNPLFIGHPPGWLNQFKELIDLPVESNIISNLNNTHTPFFHYFYPYITNLVKVVFSCFEQYLEPHATNQLTEDLISDFSTDFSLILEKEYSLYRLHNLGLITVGPDNLYFAFCAHIHANPLELFDKYPFFARRFSEKLLYTKVNLSEYIKRLQADLDDIRRLLNEPVELVSSISALLSDNHENHKNVIRTSFKNNSHSLFYKPTSSDTYFLHNKLIEFLSAGGVQINLPEIIKRPEYYWSLEVKELEDVQVNYEKIGHLLAYCYVTQTYDVHSDNVKLGNEAVLIDFEVSFLPMLAGAFDHNTDIFLNYNSLKIGILPDSFRSDIDFSLLGRPSQGVMEIKEFRNINSNWMGVDSVSRKVLAPGKLSKKPTPVQLNALLKGFRLVYLLFIEKRKEIIQIINDFKLPVKSRLVMRNTSVYVAILNHLREPEFYTSGLNFSLEIEKVFKQVSEEQAKYLPVLHEEIKSLSNGDIPFITTEFDSTSAFINSRIINGLYKCSGRQGLVNKVETLGDTDIINQQRIINKAFDYVVKRKNENTVITVLMDNCIKFDGIPLWMNQDLRNPSEPFPVDFNLYRGNSGIYLYLALFNKKHERADIEEYIHKYVNLLITNYRELHGSEKANGILVGYGSLIYFLSKLYDIDNRFNYLNLIPGIASHIKLEDIKLDLYDGSSGLLVALCYFHKISGNKVVLPTINTLAKHIPGEVNKIVDGSSDHKIITGFSHGVSGVAFSLMRYLEIHEQDPETKNLIRVLFEKENTCYSSEAINWRDDRENRKHFKTFAWCHGSPGISIARYAALEKGLDYFNDFENKCLPSLNKMALSKNKMLCCGALGQLDITFTLGMKTKNNSLVTLAVSKMEAEKKRLYSKLATDHQFSLYNGLAGLGYLELRIRDQIEADKSQLFFE